MLSLSSSVNQGYLDSLPIKGNVAEEEGVTGDFVCDVVVCSPILI